MPAMPARSARCFVVCGAFCSILQAAGGGAVAVKPGTSLRTVHAGSAAQVASVSCPKFITFLAGEGLPLSGRTHLPAFIMPANKLTPRPKTEGAKKGAPDSGGRYEGDTRLSSFFAAGFQPRLPTLLHYPHFFTTSKLEIVI